MARPAHPHAAVSRKPFPSDAAGNTDSDEVGVIDTSITPVVESGAHRRLEGPGSTESVEACKWPEQHVREVFEPECHMPAPPGQPGFAA